MENINDTIIEATENIIDEVTITELPVEEVVSGNGWATFGKLALVAGVGYAIYKGGKWVYDKVKSKKDDSQVEGEVTSEEPVADDDWDDEEN